MNERHPALRAIEGFNARAFSPHHPEMMCITCIDGRERAGGHFDYDDNAVRVTEIAAVIPPYEQAPHNIRAKFSFRKLKGVSSIKIVGHSFCGGAQAAIAHPDAGAAPDGEVCDIVQSIADSGADIIRLRNAFMMACEGNATHAANLLSRHLVLVSLDNVSRYPYINQQITGRQLDIIPLYHMMKENTGRLSHLERFDVDQQRWSRIGMTLATANMCERPHNCAACNSCHDTIDNSLKWTPIETVNDNRIEIVEVPLHIARLIQERRSFYQPALHMK